MLNRTERLLKEFGIYESTSSDQAKKLGLTYLGFGRYGKVLPRAKEYGGDIRTVTHMVVNGRLKKLRSNEQKYHANMVSDRDRDIQNRAKEMGLRRLPGRTGLFSKESVRYPSHIVRNDEIMELPSQKEQLKSEVESIINNVKHSGFGHIAYYSKGEETPGEFIPSEWQVLDGFDPVNKDRIYLLRKGTDKGTEQPVMVNMMLPYDKREEQREWLMDSFKELGTPKAPEDVTRALRDRRERGNKAVTDWYDDARRRTPKGTPTWTGD